MAVGLAKYISFPTKKERLTFKSFATDLWNYETKIEKSQTLMLTDNTKDLH